MIKSEPDKTLGELMQRKQSRHGGEKKFSPVFYLQKGGYANRAQDGTPGEVGGRAKTHGGFSRGSSQKKIVPRGRFVDLGFLTKLPGGDQKRKPKRTMESGCRNPLQRAAIATLTPMLRPSP
jgi:hypothetical protein